MKAVTIAKIARLIVVIAVAVVIAIPAFAGVESMRFNKGEFVETDSVYEVTHMTSGDLKSNINEVTGGNPGYKVRYGSTLEAVPTADSEIDELIGRMKTASEGKDSFEATMMDSEGKVCRQQMIMGSNGLTQYITTGIKLTESMVKMVKISVSLDSVLFDSRNKISDVIVDRIEDSYRITIPIPYILFATALAGGEDSKLGLSIGIEYNNFFSAMFRLDLPIEKLMKSGEGGGDIPKIDCNVRNDAHTYDGNDSHYDGVTVNQEINITLPGELTGLSKISASLGKFGSSENGVRIEVNEDGKVQMMTDNPQGLVEELKSNINDKGELVLDIEGEGDIPKTFTIEKEYVDSFLSMSDDIIKILGAMSS